LSAALIAARAVTRTYTTEAGDVHALRGVDIDIAEGEVVCMLGPSGCGKTTLLNCLSGIDVPTSGQVEFAGRRLDQMTDGQRTGLRAREMGFVFQAFNLVQVLTAVENVELPLLLAGVPAAKAEKRAFGALSTVGLVERARHLPAELSGGEQQRVALARSLVTGPRVVWADEPTGNLDAANGRRILELMAQLNDGERQTYVIVTHDVKAIDIAHRVVHLESGRIVREEAGGRGKR
jgi:putative ABC transport system ATP-binding protein